MYWLDPDYLPTTAGTLARFVPNGKAEIDGLILADGTEIHTSPHLSRELLKTLVIGSALTVRGVKARGCDLIVAVAIDSGDHLRILDGGPEHSGPRPPDMKPRGEPATHAGEIQHLLHGPKGDTHGALLTDGVVVRWPPHAGNAFAEILRNGARLGVRGRRLETPAGGVIEAEAMGASVATLEPVPKKHDKKSNKHAEPDDHGRHH